MWGQITFYLRFFLVMLWVVVCCVGVILCWPFYRGSPNAFSRSIRILGKGILFFSGFEVEARHEEYLIDNQPAVIIGNHQSNFDVAIFGSLTQPRTTVVGKKEILQMPLIGLFFKAVGIIFIDRKNSESARKELAAAGKRMREEKINVAILPEGTRNKDGLSLLPFKKGAFHLAIQAQVPVVALVCPPLSYLVNFKNRSAKFGKIPVEYLPPISTQGLTENDVDALTDKARNQMESTFQKLRKEMESRYS